MVRFWTGISLALLAGLCVCRGDEATTPDEVQTQDEVQTPSIMVGLIEGKGFNISIPDAGKHMTEFKYYVGFNQEFEKATEVFCKNRVECFSDQSKFRLAKDKELKEGDTLHFYLVGFRKPEAFQMERVYEVKKNDEGVLEFQQKSERAGLVKEGAWYQLDNLKSS